MHECPALHLSVHGQGRYPLPKLWVPSYWQVTTDSPGTPNGNMCRRWEIALVVCHFLMEVGTKAGHGVHGDRCFPSNELWDSTLGH